VVEGLSKELSQIACKGIKKEALVAMCSGLKAVALRSWQIHTDSSGLMILYCKHRKTVSWFIGASVLLLIIC